MANFDLKQIIQKQAQREVESFEHNRKWSWGITVGVDYDDSPAVLGMPGYIYVREHSTQVDGRGGLLRVFNNTVPLQVGLMVKIARNPNDPSQRQVIGSDTGDTVYTSWWDGGPGSGGPHHESHEWPDGAPGSDPVSVYKRALVPLRTYPSSSLYAMNVDVAPILYKLNGVPVYYAGDSNFDLSAYAPTATSDTVYALIYLDTADNTLKVTTETYSGGFWEGGLPGSTLAANLPYFPSLPEGGMASAVIIIQGADTTVTESMIYDVRTLFDPPQIPHPIVLDGATTLQITSGAVTATTDFHLLQSESGVADELTDIVEAKDRQLLLIQALPGHTITVKHAAGNIYLNGSADFELSGNKSLLLFHDGTNWSDVGAGGGGGGGGGGSATTIAARYTSVTPQSIPDGYYTATIFDFDTADYDTHSAVTTGSGWHFTAPESGFYAVHAQIMFASTDTWAPEEGVSLWLFRNGTRISAMGRENALDSSGGAYQHSAQGTGFIYLSAGDALDVRVTQSSGAALNTYDDYEWANEPYHNWVIIFRVGGAGALADLTDVTLTTPADGDVLTWDADTEEWINAPASGGGAEELNDLYDVSITGLSNGELLISNSGEWINQTPAEANLSVLGHTHVEADITDLDKYTQDETDNLLDGKSNVGHTHILADITDYEPGGDLYLNDLLDVDISSAIDMSLLLYELASGVWKNKSAAEAGLSEIGHTHVEADITDLYHDAVMLQGRNISIAAPDDNDVLTWDDDASEWVPAAPTGGGDDGRILGGYTYISNDEKADYNSVSAAYNDIGVRGELLIGYGVGGILTHETLVLSGGHTLTPIESHSARAEDVEAAWDLNGKFLQIRNFYIDLIIEDATGITGPISIIKNTSSAGPSRVLLESCRIRVINNTGTTLDACILAGPESYDWVLLQDCLIEFKGNLGTTQIVEDDIVDRLRLQGLNRIELDWPNDVGLDAIGDTNVATEGFLTDGEQWFLPDGTTSPVGGSGIDADAIHDNIAGEIQAITEKEEPVADDLLLIEDSEDGYAKKRVEIGNLPVAETVPGDFHVGGFLEVGGPLATMGGSATAFASPKLRHRGNFIVANNDVVDLFPYGSPGSLALGFVFITSSSAGQGAIFYIRGGGNATILLAQSGTLFTVTAGTANRINVYWSAANNRYELQNLVGSNQGIEITYLCR
jgi:hypothetical protein